MNKLFNGVFGNKKVIITGDTGFKGSWLAIWLKELGADVFGYALPPKTPKDNFVSANLHTIIKHEDGDVRDGKHLLKFFDEVKPDIAFHLASQPLVIESYENPHYTFETNLMGTVNFFEAIRNSKSVKAAINVTSDKCYQNYEWTRGYNETDAMGGKDPYSASKGCSELITSAYLNSFFQKEGTCNIASVRAGNVIGGGDWAENRIVPDFFRAIEENETLFLRYPYATRPWQHVLEPLSGYLFLGAMLLSKGKEYSGAWNFGPSDTNNFSVLDLVRSMIEIAQKGSYKFDEKMEKLHEASFLRLDISKVINFLGWRPALNFRESVEFTVNGYLDENEQNVYEKRKQQILNYIKLAYEKNIEWTKSNSN